MDSRQALISELARAIGLVASGADGEAHDAIRAMARALDTQASLPGITPPTVSKVNADAARKLTAMELLRYWQRECGHESARMTAERITAVMARLREGYSAGEVRKAIDGAKHDAFVSENGKRHDDITLICRNGSKLESFIERGERHTGAIVVETVSTGGLEEQIAALRRTMATLKRDGRGLEYEAHSKDLQALMARRDTTAGAER